MNVTCLKCQEELSVSFYDMLPLDRKNKELLKTNDLFTVVCPKCQNRMKINYDCMLVDEKNRYALALVIDEEDQGNIISTFENHDSSFKKRIVSSQQEALEKTYIFDSHLNDYAIEIMKGVHRIGLLKEMGTDNDIRIYFTKDPIVCFAVIVNKEVFSLEFEKDFYDQVVQEFSDTVEDNFVRIDSNWALKMLSSGL